MSTEAFRGKHTDRTSPEERRLASSGSESTGLSRPRTTTVGRSGRGGNPNRVNIDPPPLKRTYTLDHGPSTGTSHHGLTTAKLPLATCPQGGGRTTPHNRRS